MFSALFLASQSKELVTAIGLLLMLIPAVVIVVGFVIAPLFIWSWCKHVAKAVEENTAELRSLHDTLRYLAQNQSATLQSNSPNGLYPMDAPSRSEIDFQSRMS